MARLTNETSISRIIDICADKHATLDISDLSPAKIRQLPDVIHATIIFEGTELTLNATHIRKLNAFDATKINLPRLKASQEIWAENAEISAPALASGGTIIVAHHLNDTKYCSHIGTLILGAEGINLRGVQSFGFAEFANAKHIFLHDTDTIGSELKALQARHIAAPALETLTGYFNTSQLKVITLSKDFIASMGGTQDTHISQSAEIKVCDPNYLANRPA